MFIDVPAANDAVHGAFTIAGWALDPQAAIGSGIDAVHVWAKPVATIGRGGRSSSARRPWPAPARCGGGVRRTVRSHGL